MDPASATERRTAQDRAVAETREAEMEHHRFAESELCVEIERNLADVQARIERLVQRHGSEMTDAEVDTFLEVDRLLYDVVLDLARLEARELMLVRLP